MELSQSCRTKVGWRGKGWGEPSSCRSKTRACPCLVGWSQMKGFSCAPSLLSWLCICNKASRWGTFLLILTCRQFFPSTCALWWIYLGSREPWTPWLLWWLPAPFLFFIFCFGLMYAYRPKPGRERKSNMQIMIALQHVPAKEMERKGSEVARGTVELPLNGPRKWCWWDQEREFMRVYPQGLFAGCYVLLWATSNCGLEYMGRQKRMN